MKKRTTLIPISVLVVLASLMSLLIALPLSATHIGVTQAVTLQVLDAPSSGGGTVQSTTVSGVQYVSNTTTAHDWVKVTVVDDSHTLDDALTTTATVTNISTNLAISGGITLTRSTSTPPTTPFVGEFRVAATATSTTIGASNGHTIRVAHGLFPKQLVVDGKLPAGTGFSPTSGTVTKARTITLSGDITDTPSSGIPTVVVGGKVVPNPAAVQINLKTAANSSTDMAAATNVEPQVGVAGWTAITNGFRFTILLFIPEGITNYQVRVMDRAGNTRTTDSDAVTSGAQPHSITVDATPAILGRATTGKTWDSVNKKLKAARNSVMMEFIRFGTDDPDVTANHDPVDCGTVDAADFLIGGVQPTGVICPGLKASTTSDGTETRNLVFATMPSDLGAAEKPLARVVGSLNDRAGNITSTGDKQAVDGIGPRLTPTVTGEASSRPIASGKTGVKVTVRVVSDEALSGPPTVTFSTLDETSTTSPFLSEDRSVSVPAPAVTGFVNTWEATRILTEAPTSGEGLVNVHISGTDPSTNQGAAGVDPAGLVDLSKAILFEFDNQLNGGAAPTFRLTPRVGDTGTAATQTESTKPFIRVDLNGEGTEYNVGTGDLDGDGNNDKVTIGTKTVELDSHNGVTRTVVKLDGVDILGTANVGTIDSNSFQVSTAGLALGTHTLEVNATDDVGNTSLVNFKFTFTVIARRAHSVGMVPGFSQVSFPAEPVDPDINVVLAGNPAITAVLTYDPLDPAGPWLVATRAPNIVAGIVLPGKLEGTLKTIDGRHAYWIQTTTFDPIKTVLAEPDFTSPPTAIPLVAGWNLVPVTDVQLAKIGTMILADTYFASATWTVAYHFDSSSNKWIKVIPGDAQSVKSGQGWWLFVTESGNLVP